jgi:phosphoribosyl-AMP cyclohydrolase / phosphoribosyl-ATP pyrophosphohydrolase
VELLCVETDMNFRIEDLKFDECGLIPAIVQDAQTREVLTLAYMNRESLERTVATNATWFWSRSRSELWHKGETSGNTQRVVEVILDCDQDAIVVLVEPAGPACHTGERTCFHNAIGSDVQGLMLDTERSAEAPQSKVWTNEGRKDNREAEDLGALLNQLYDLVESRKRERPDGSYTTYLFNEGLDKILKKVGEESAETIIAAKNENTNGLVAEVSDLIYHLLVLLVERGVSLDEIRQEMAQRGKHASRG